MFERANSRWSATEEMELLGCIGRNDVKAWAEQTGRPFTACLTKRSALLNGRRDKSGWQRMKAEPSTRAEPHPQRSDAWRKRDEAFVAAVIKEGVRLGLVKVVSNAST
jgi:hypothetical protein